MARTGSGKTAAFLLPMFQRLQEKANTKGAKPGPKALVMSPTRELALQTFKFAKQVGDSSCQTQSNLKSVSFFDRFALSLANTPTSKWP